MNIYDVILSKSAEKDLRQIPAHVVLKLQAWVDDVKHQGLNNVRKIPGYHDEPLQGKRKGQRSIRLSKAYRANYVIKENGQIEFIEIIEVNKHEY